MMHGAGVLLFAVAAGYWVLERASAQKGQLKQLGQFLGALIVVLALAGVAMELLGLGPYGLGRKGGAWCPMMPKGDSMGARMPASAP